MEQIRRRGVEVVLGIALSFALVIGIVLVWESFSGTFSDKVTVSAQLSQAGDALEVGDIVTYLDVIIGEVTGTTGQLSGGATVTLKLDPAAAAVVPAHVTAVALPESLFGATRIELVATADDSGPKLKNGDVIKADTSPAGESLQTALANAYTLLSAVHPAQLDQALSALATALQGQGANLGKLIVTADNYLRRLAPHLPELEQTITSLATVTTDLARNSPALLSTLRNTLVVSQGILADKQAIANLLNVAPTTVDNASALLSPTNVDNAVTIFRNEGPVAAAFAANPQALPQTLNGFKQFADTFGSAINGSSLRANIILTGVNFAELANVAANGEGDMFRAISDPPEYTAADCPRYIGADGPNCGSAAGPDGASARVITTGSDYGGTSSSIGSASEVFAVRAAASTITGLPVSAIPAGLTNLLLGPLLRGIPTVVNHE